MITEKDSHIFNVEIGEERKSSVCACCGRESYVGHGFVYKHNDAYAIYYAGWAPSHSPRKVTFAIAIGEWDDNSTSNDRTCFGLEVRIKEGELELMVVAPEDSPWPETKLLGKMLSRNDALTHPLANNAKEIAELVVRKHAAIQQYLAIIS